jgi:hypothetical protein
VGPGKVRCEVVGAVILPLPKLLVAVKLRQVNWGLALPWVLMLLAESLLTVVPWATTYRARHDI